jgi:Flp pilus assembly protein TadB
MTLIIVNPKGRIVSVLSAIAWSVCLAMLAIRGDWSLGPILLAVLFILLLALSGVRIYQEWVEDGEWLD